MLRRTTLATAALLAAGLLALTACTGGGGEPAPTATGEPDPDASVAIRLVLEPGNLDIRETAGSALDQILVDNIYQGLVTRTPEQDIVPALASDWTVSPDGLTYTFTLREGVTFHDGQPLTPQDVVWSLTTRTRHPGVARLGAARERRRRSRPRGRTISAHAERAGLDPAVEPHRPRRPRPQGGRHRRLQDRGERHRPVRARRLAPGRQHHVRPQRRLLGRPGRRSPRSCSTTSPTTRRPSTRRWPARSTCSPDSTRTCRSRSRRTATSPSSSASPPTRARSRSTRPPARSPTSACARRSARRSTTTPSSRRSASGQTQYGPIPELDPGYEDLSDVAPYDPEAARELLAEAGRRGPRAHAHDPELLLDDDPADPRVGPRRGRHHARGRTPSTSRPGSPTSTRTRTTT